MRDFLTGLAIILIVVLTTVLVAPYFVDWNSQRGFLEARLTHGLGQKVTIGGHIDLKLLPTPYLVLDQVVVGDDDAPIRIGIHHLDLELTVAPLLHGEFDIVEARLEEPTIRVSLERDRTLPALPKAPAFQADVRFDRIQISDGTLAIADPLSGRTFVLDHLDLDADAGSFSGPFKVSGAEGPAERRTKFRLATTAAETNRARVRLIVDETPTHVGLQLDGTVDLAGADHDTIRQSFEGSLVVSGHLSQATDAPTAWALSGPFKADPHEAALDGGALRLGSDDAGVTLQANATAAFGEQPKLSLDLSAKQLDFDRLSGAPVDAVKPPPPKLPNLETLRHILAAARPPIQTGVDLAVDNATYGGETLSDLEAHLGFGDDAHQPLKLSGDGPGGSHIAIDGQVSTDDDRPTFAGQIDLEADNLPRAVDWLGSVASYVPWAGRDLLFKSVKLAGNVRASAEAIAGDHLALTLDRSTLSGTAALTQGDGRTPAKVMADLKAETLDLDGLPSFGAIRGGSSPLDLDLHLDAKAIKVSQVGDGALESGHIRIAVAKTGRRVDLAEFRADDLGGATIQATGHLDPGQVTLAMTLDAARLDAAAALVRRLTPGQMSDTLVARASALAPAKLKIDAALTSKADGTLVPSQVSVAGQLGATRVDASAKPDASLPGATLVSASVAAPDGGPLLNQFGLPALPLNMLGPSRVTVEARGKPDEQLDSTIAATFGETTLDVMGRFDILSATRKGTGTLRLKSQDLTPLLQSLAVAFPDMTGHIPADMTGAVTLGGGETSLHDLKGRLGGLAANGSLRYRQTAGDQPALTGSLEFDRLTLSSLLGLALGPPQPSAANALWSRQPFAVGLIDPPRCSVALKAKTLEIIPGLDATNATLDLGVAPNIVTISKGAADLTGGRIEGEATIRRDGPQASVEGKVALDHVGVHVAPLDTRLDAKLDVAGGGSSSLGLIASLAGSGEATAADLTIPGGNPGALPKIFQDVETDVLTVDQDAVIRGFDQPVQAPLSLGTRHFGVSLAAGVLHFEPKDPNPSKTGPVSSKVTAALDLTQTHITQHLEEALDALPKNWTGAPPTIVITFAGPLAKPARTVDVSGFLNVVAARALARETARVEAYEFDIRERAFFNARLQSERRREEERQKAEADRKARIEAARLEHMRQEAAAKAARENDVKPPTQEPGTPQPDVAKPSPDLR